MELTYPYKPKPWTMALAVTLFGGLALYMGDMALHNDRGLVLTQAIRFSTRGASILYWCITVAAVAFVVAGIAAFFVTLNRSHQVTLTAKHISAPRYGLSRQPTVVPLSAIKTLELQTMQRQRFLHIQHQGGRLSIAASHLPNSVAFEDLCSALARNVTECRAAQASASTGEAEPDR